MKSYAYAALLILAPSLAFAECREDGVDLRLQNGNTARFSIELADEPQERSQGLMNRAEMASSAGMLFVFERPGRVAFWMKNTLIPLDMIFTDETGLVTRVHSNAIPHDETPIDGGEGVMTVLEINGGLAKRLGITEGAVLRHPSLAQEIAAWPCATQ
jgi:uncharacterized protein